jgi:hypothetical protein
VAAGGAALNIRYLRAASLSPSDAGSSLGMSQVIAFGLHIPQLVILPAFTGAASKNRLRPPDWVWIALAAVAAVLLFRLVTFWLPVPFGWMARTCLQRRDAL